MNTLQKSNTRSHTLPMSSSFPQNVQKRSECVRTGAFTATPANRNKLEMRQSIQPELNIIPPEAPHFFPS